MVSAEGVPGAKWWKTTATNGYFWLSPNLLCSPTTCNKQDLCLAPRLHPVSALDQVLMPKSRGVGTGLGGYNPKSWAGWPSQRKERLGLAQAWVAGHRFLKPSGTALQHYLQKTWSDSISDSYLWSSNWACVRDTGKLLLSVWAIIKEVEKPPSCGCRTVVFSRDAAVVCLIPNNIYFW